MRMCVEPICYLKWMVYGIESANHNSFIRRTCVENQGVASYRYGLCLQPIWNYRWLIFNQPFSGVGDCAAQAGAARALGAAAHWRYLPALFKNAQWAGVNQLRDSRSRRLITTKPLD